MNEHLKYDIDIVVAVEKEDIFKTSKLFYFLLIFSASVHT